MLHSLTNHKWSDHYSDSVQNQALTSLENGRIIYFADLNFKLQADEQYFLSTQHVDPHAKNISYDSARNKLWGVRNLSDADHLKLKAMLERFTRAAKQLMSNLFPRYVPQLILGRTSFRPVQVSNRKTSYRKDDRRLHVDAFPSAPNQGKRILRVFCNINPQAEDRIWRVGEPFEQVAARFLSQLPKPLPGSAALLRALKITKSYRTPYDHYMLHLHDAMKADEDYQRTATQQEVRFPPGSSWIVQTDHVSHAAMSGQYVLEQTFYLPVTAMHEESLSPLRTLEMMLGQPLT
jgi:hypothetical protein